MLTRRIFRPSDIGVGAVIGGEVFNVLVIIGTAILATPDVYMPLKMDSLSFHRDVFFYSLSVVVLYLSLQNSVIDTGDTVMLLMGAVSYSTTVIYSGTIRSWLKKKRMRAHERRVQRELERQASQGAELEEVPGSPGSPGGKGRRKSLSWKSLEEPLLSVVDTMDRQVSEGDEVEHFFEEHRDSKVLKKWESARNSADPLEGSVIYIRVELRNRLMDKKHIGEERFVWLHDDCLMVSAGVGPGDKNQDEENRLDMVYEYGNHRHHNLLRMNILILFYLLLNIYLYYYMHFSLK